MNTRVVFYQVKDAASKLSRIAETAGHHFLRKEKILILVEEDKALAFVDELLWKHLPDSFLPHSIANAKTDDWIAITKNKSNVNDARIAFNLCPTPLLIEGPFRFIYDFEDLTSAAKKNLSQIRFDAYKQAQYLIESRETLH